jgi:hypothetical protein
MRSIYRTLIIAAVTAPAALWGQVQTQQATRGQLPLTEVRLFPLQHLSNADAAKLIAPFTNQPFEQVYEPGAAVRGVTVRASAATLAMIDSLLTTHDQPPVTIVLRFQVIAASDSALRDPQISAEVLSALREALPFTGYRQVAATTVAVSPSARRGFATTMTGGDEQLRLSGNMTGIGFRVEAQPRPGVARAVTSAALEVNLYGLSLSTPPGTSWNPLVTTTLSVPIGQTVVIGSASTATNQKALILVVRPEVR